MPQQRGRGLSQAEWLALCLISEGPTHGFAIVGLLAQDGSLGHVWHVQKTVISRAVRRLEHLGLITVSPKQPNRLAPEKAQLQVTPDGRQAAEGWLRRPADHHRDIRSELLVKLALLDRAGIDPRDLLRAQRGQLLPIAAALASEMRTATGYNYALALWRTNRSRRRCGFSTLYWQRCLHSGLVPHAADGDQRRDFCGAPRITGKAEVSCCPHA